MPPRTRSTFGRYRPYSSPTKSLSSDDSLSGCSTFALPLRPPVANQPLQRVVFPNGAVLANPDSFSSIAKLQAKAVVAEMDSFFAEIRRDFPWIPKRFTTLTDFEDDRYLLDYGPEQVDQATEIMVRINSFRQHLDQKYPWLRATLHDSGEPRSSLRDVPVEVYYAKPSGTNKNTSNGNKANSDSNVTVNDTDTLRYPDSDSCDTCVEGIADPDWVEEVTPAKKPKGGRGRNKAKTPAKPAMADPVESGKSTKSLAVPNYGSWASGTGVDCVQWARDAAEAGSKYMQALRLKPLKSLYLHPDFAISKNTWMYIMAGASPDDANKSAIGDILFGPAIIFPLSGVLQDDVNMMRTPFKYWVCSPQEDVPVLNRWMPIELGGSHPLGGGFVLQHFYGQIPFWVYRGTEKGKEKARVEEVLSVNDRVEQMEIA